jgi:hypothetical protein
MRQTEKEPAEQTGTEAQEQDPEIGPGTQPGDDTNDSGSPGGRP